MDRKTSGIVNVTMMMTMIMGSTQKNADISPKPSIGLIGLIVPRIEKGTS